MLIRLVIAVITAFIISGFYQAHVPAPGKGIFAIEGIFVIDLISMASFILATVVTVLLTSIAELPGLTQYGYSGNQRKREPNLEREEGTVKWFNVSKGFGFITRSNDEDIFVHYRSIRGHGRRRLFDGQVVSFSVIDSDKGLQADDVEIIK